ncbi:MAG: hypothetical protein AAF578_09095 [Pseudomonadota bacterium]
MKKARQIPWPRISAEGFAIVISILLAFGIDAWWSNREEDKLTDESLAALRDELQNNLLEIQHERRFRVAVIASMDELFALTTAARPLDESEVDSLLEKITWGGRIDISTGALVSILESGALTTIDNGALKRSIAALPFLIETTSFNEKGAWAFLEGELILFLNREGSLVQVYNAGVGQGRPGGGGEMASGTKFPSRFSAEHSVLLDNNQFIGLLAIGQSKHENVVLYYDRLEAAVQQAIELIDQHLD